MAEQTNSCLSPEERAQIDGIEATLAKILRLQKIGNLSTGEETTFARSTTSEGCCFSGISTGGCSPRTNQPKVIAATPN